MKHRQRSISMSKEQLQKLRQLVDEEDFIIKSALRRRYELTAQVARLKQQSGLPFRDAAREQEVVATGGCDTGQLEEQLMVAVYTVILSHSRLQWQAIEKDQGPDTS
jgi:chorismate mutase